MRPARKRTPLAWLLLAIALVVAWQAWPTRDAIPGAVAGSGAPSTSQAGFLPVDAHRTIALIQRGGPYPHRQDGGVFGNREGHLPRQPRGWYREYTVETPGLDHRGARRIVTGDQPPRDWYYTDDHYDSFRRFDVAGAAR